MLQGTNTILWWGIIGVGVLAIIPYIIIIRLNNKIKRFQAAHISLQTFMSGESLDKLLENYLEQTEKLGQQLTELERRMNIVENKQRLAVDHAELLRFNAFENMGSDLSFALALLNDEGNGVVISSIHNREESRVYAKPIIEGKSNYQLSNEEREVIFKGMEK